jgi:multiple antibiotic resistance protein
MMLHLFVTAFIALFVVIDPPGCAPIFAGLVSGAPYRHAASMAVRATVIATAILLGFALFGRKLLAALGIELDSFRIAGGMMLFLIALDMVFDKRTQRREERVEKVREEHLEDISVFPMAMPMIAGPGSIATLMLLVSHARSHEELAAVLLALLAVMALTLFSLLAAGPLMRLLGARVEAVITRVLGVLLGAMAVQFVIDGLRGAIGLGS